jgi:hypothetical protein
MDGPSYYKTAIPEPWTILGLRLRPFALGHVLILHRFESPLVGDISTAISADLLFAVFVCSRTYENALDALNDPRLFDWIADWSRKLCRPNIQQRIGLAAPAAIDWPEKFKAFAQYMVEGSKYPAFSVSMEQRPAEMSIPLIQIVRCVLLSKTSLTETEIMNRPWGQALTDYITIRAMEGAVQIVDADAIQDAFKQAKELYEKLNPKAQDGVGSESTD